MIERLFKVLIIGDGTVGKTSFVERYVSNRFRDDYKTTIGDFALKVLSLNDDETIRLQLWDIGGQERYTSLTRVYYKDASACVIMFDVTMHKTFSSVMKWKNDLDSKVSLKDGSPLPCLLLANKCDLSQNRAVSSSDIQELSQNNGFIGWSEISVKESSNISESMMFLVEEILARNTLSGQPGSVADELTDSTGRITLTPNTSKSSGFCCQQS
ncbi:ras-related protein Rab-7L1-like isoform X2 [Antedon mediterranea]|uniref:ras-related protein Rab-7L1-like isoform X2 n=1 Tax=Antedon mediterranea TaxID=105859 RepID=UPI003AF47322